MTNVQLAERLLVMRYFASFAAKISDAERNDFFDARNKDLWTREFARFLEAQADGEFRSND